MSKFKNITHGRHEGKVILTKSIIDSIVILSIDELENVKLFSLPKKNAQTNDSVKVEFLKDGLEIQVKVKVLYTERISTISFKVQEAIRHNIETMTEYSVSSVNIVVCGVYFEEEPKEKEEKSEQFSLINAAEETKAKSNKNDGANN